MYPHGVFLVLKSPQASYYPVSRLSVFCCGKLNLASGRATRGLGQGKESLHANPLLVNSTPRKVASRGKLSFAVSQNNQPVELKKNVNKHNRKY